MLPPLSEALVHLEQTFAPPLTHLLVAWAAAACVCRSNTADSRMAARWCSTLGRRIEEAAWLRPVDREGSVVAFRGPALNERSGRRWRDEPELGRARVVRKPVVRKFTGSAHYGEIGLDLAVAALRFLA